MILKDRSVPQSTSYKISGYTTTVTIHNKPCNMQGSCLFDHGHTEATVMTAENNCATELPLHSVYTQSKKVSHTPHHVVVYTY